MVDVQSPANGHARGASTEPAETSRDGLRRMQRLSEATRVPCNPYVAAFHPLTSALVFPPSNHKQHHVVASVFSESPRSRSVPIPSVFSRAEMLSISPDGAWLTGFHAAVPGSLPRPGAEAGELKIYGSGLLDVSTIQGTYVPIVSFPFSSTPLAMLHVYPPRTRLGEGGREAAPALGPSPPPGHAAARVRGPTLVVLTSELVYFFHPHPLPAITTLDTRSSAAMPGESVSGAVGGGPPLNWTINALRCPIGARAYADLANPGPQTANLHAQRGWLGMVGGSDGVWAAVERDGVLSALRIDIGLDANNIPYLATTPLPTLPRTQVDRFADSSASPESYLEHVAFVPLKDGEKSEDAGVGLVSVYHDVDGAEPQRKRTRLELCELRHRSITVVEGFKELGSGDDAVSLLDWVPTKSRTTSTSPEGTNILALTPLSDVPPHTLALALVSSPSGLVLTHVNLVPQSEGDTSGSGEPRWSAITGEEIPLGPEIAAGPEGEVTLVASQGTRRGELGLVGVFSNSCPPKLEPAPRLGADARPVETLKHMATRAARAVELAVVQGVDWSDSIRAAFMIIPKAEAADLASAILEHALDLFIKHSRSYVPHILRLQVAVWAMIQDPRRALAAELLRVGEASQVLLLCASDKDGVVSFDLDSVWNLVDVFEWGLSFIGATLREAIAERAYGEWSPSEPRTSGSSRVLYLVHPLLRRIISRFIALLAAFSKFVSTLDLPIRPPDSALFVTRSAQSTWVAISRVQDALAREGVDLTLWSDTLGNMAKTRPSDADTVASLLRMDIGPLGPLVQQALAALPCPSSLYGTCSDTSSSRDGATLAVIGDRPTALCDRCGAATVLAANNVMRGAATSPWAAWRRNWVSGCCCGGTWVRQKLERR